MNQRALVTGAAGFIGRHIADALEASGWSVFRNDIRVTPQTDGIDCRYIFQGERRFDLVIHCAAVVGGRMTIDHQPMKVATDLAIDSDFYQYIARTDPWRAVYFSSSAAYPIDLQTMGHVRTQVMMRSTKPGQLHESRIDLDRPQKPDAIYGWVKLTGEQLARYANAQGSQVHVFRPFSGYGADQDLDYPFPSIMQRAQDGANPFDVWGNGDQTRDFIHVDDVVGAVLAMVPIPPRELGPVNLCTGQATSFNQLIQLARPGAEINRLLDKPVGVEYRVGDPDRMLGFYAPKVTLAEGVRRALVSEPVI